ncbi:NAD(P)-binding domain-containing protein [Flavobacteriales bacterium]|nr:NAD(P)-binding domain-containing protein [Flavobacteriales bacterium]
MKVLLTSTSFQDCEGSHKDLLAQQGWDVSYLRGPLRKDEIIDVIADYDALICGDDELDGEVLLRGKSGKLKFISKYGVGLDKIDLKKADELDIPVRNCTGVNQAAVAEHVLGMLFSHAKNIHASHIVTSQGGWKRPVGMEIVGKRMGIVGFGAIGKELALKSVALGMKVSVYDIKLDQDFLSDHDLNVSTSLEQMFQSCDIISLHVPLNEHTSNMITRELLFHAKTKKGLILINTARAGLVTEELIVEALEKEQIGGYLADVLDEEPMSPHCLLRGAPRVLITPHVGSRTTESIQRQGAMAVENLVGLVATE